MRTRRTHKREVQRALKRMRSRTPAQVAQLLLINEALDAATEFGIESWSRDRLLIRIGEITAALRALRTTIR